MCLPFSQGTIGRPLLSLVTSSSVKLAPRENQVFSEGIRLGSEGAAPSPSGGRLRICQPICQPPRTHLFCVPPKFRAAEVTYRKGAYRKRDERLERERVAALVTARNLPPDEAAERRTMEKIAWMRKKGVPQFGQYRHQLEKYETKYGKIEP